MPQSPRLHRALLERLQSEPPQTFPRYALEEIKRVQLALHDVTFGAHLGAILEEEGFAIDEERLSDYIQRRGRGMAFVLVYYRHLQGALWRGGDGGSKEEILTFLERNPFTFQSGYRKQEWTRRLAKLDLAVQDRARIAMLLREVILGGWRISMPGWPRLRALCPSETIEAIVREALISPREDIVKKGALLLLLHRGKTHLYGSLKGRDYRRERDWPAVIRWARDEIAASTALRETNPEPTLPGLS